jgi:hypothetical protein
MIKYFPLFALLFGSPVFAGNENIVGAAASNGIGGASVCVSDLWSVQNNQAGLARLKSVELGVFSERRYMLSQLSNNAAAIAMPTKQGTFALNFSRFGYSQYNESKYAFAFAKGFGANFSAGLQIDYLTMHLGDNYGDRRTFSVEAGIQARIVKGLTLGAHIYNPTRAKAASYNNERIPGIMRLGLKYDFSEKVFWSIETEKDIDHKPVFKTGIEYHVIRELFLRGGFSNNPMVTSFGFGLDLKKFKLDFYNSFHPQLGYTPGLSMNYRIK